MITTLMRLTLGAGLLLGACSGDGVADGQVSLSDASSLGKDDSLQGKPIRYTFTSEQALTTTELLLHVSGQLQASPFTDPAEPARDGVAISAPLFVLPRLDAGYQTVWIDGDRLTDRRAMLVFHRAKGAARWSAVDCASLAANYFGQMTIAAEALLLQRIGDSATDWRRVQGECGVDEVEAEFAVFPLVRWDLWSLEGTYEFVLTRQVR